MDNRGWESLRTLLTAESFRRRRFFESLCPLVRTRSQLCSLSAFDVRATIWAHRAGGFSSHGNLSKWVLHSLFHWWGNRGSEKLRKLSRITQLLRADPQFESSSPYSMAWSTSSMASHGQTWTPAKISLVFCWALQPARHWTSLQNSKLIPKC